MFTVTPASATAGAVYSNNGGTFSVANTVSGSNQLTMSPVTGNPGPNGTLTLVSGTGDTTITFTAQSQFMTFTCTNSAAYCPTPGTYAMSQSLKDYVGQQMSSGFFNSNGSSTTLFGRLNSALGIPCVIGHLINSVDTDGLPVAGTYSITFPGDTSNIIYQTASNGGCGMGSNMAGQGPISITFANVTGSSYYNKSMSLNVGNQISVYLKLDIPNGILNIMSVESQLSGGRYAADRTIVNMSGMNTSGGTKIAFEYVSAGSNCTAGGAAGNSMANCGTKNGLGTGAAVSSSYNGSNWTTDFEFHRGYIDQANDVAYLLSHHGSPGKTDGSVDATHPASRVMFTAAGKPNEISACTATSCSQKIAMSFGFVGQNDGGGGQSIGEAANAVNSTDFNGCVGVSGLASTDDSTLATCGVTGTAASAAQNMVDLARAHYSADAVTVITGSDGSTGLAFTNGTNMYTAPF